MRKKAPTLSELQKYESEYSEPKFWGKVGKVAKKAGEKVIHLALVLHYTLASPDVSMQNKALIIGALGYFILPVDLIPDFIPLLGFTDDLSALVLAYQAVKTSVTPEITARADAKLKSWFA